MVVHKSKTSRNMLLYVAVPGRYSVFNWLDLIKYSGYMLLNVMLEISTHLADRW